MTSPIGFNLLLARGLALAVLSFALWDAWRFPVFPEAIAIGLAFYAVALAVEVRLWLLLLPSAIALLSLGYWSGRYFWDALDLCMLVTVAGGLWSSTPWWPDRPALKAVWPLGLFLLIQIAVTLNGLYPLEMPAEGLRADYYASTNALREFKGILWAVLLMPMLIQAQRLDRYAARWLVAGMAIGLLSLVLAILWERNLYTGIWNFGHAYRVSGWFFALHTGGAAIDVALAMMLPFVFGLWVWWRKWPAHLAMLALLVMGAYGLFVTFSRANYPAVGAIFLVLVLGLLTLPGMAIRRRRVFGLRAYLIGGALLALVPVLIGGTIAERFKTTAHDLQTRLDHWQSGIALANSGFEHWAGIGKGAFPRRYHFVAAVDGENLATLFRHQEGELAFMRFSASDRNGSLDLRQRFRSSDQHVRLKFLARTAPGTKERLLIEFCERHVLRVRAECDWVGTNIADTQGEWREYNKLISIGKLGEGSFLQRSPVDISILNRGIKQGLDIASVRLIDVKGGDLLANSDFSQGMDQWFMVDGNHLRWHVKSIFVYAYVEGGVLGLAVFVLLVVSALKRSWTLHRNGDPAGIIFAASIAAGLAIGLFDSILDVPRVTILFLLPVFAVLVWKPQPVGLAERIPAYPGWMPRPLFVALGLAGLMITMLGVRQVLSNRLSFSQSVVHYGEKLGFDHRFLVGLTNAPADNFGAAYALHPAEGRPRIWRDVLPGARDLTCASGDMKRDAVCWAVHQDELAGRKAMGSLLNMWDVKPQSYGQYGNGWLLAMIYDLLSDHPAMTSAVRQQFQVRLQRVLSHYLLLLNSDGPAVWHGRATLAAQAMIVGSTMEPSDDHVDNLLRQTHYHYLQLLNMLSVAEAWPEGYNYWANTRGFLIALAGYAYMKAFPEALGKEDTRRVFSRIGLWHIYNSRPDIKAIQIADEGPRIDLGEETQRIIDVLALTTDDPWLLSYSAMIEQKFGKRGYYRGYRWLRPLLRHAERDSSASSPDQWALPTSAWFGRDAFNMIYLRSDWSEDATVLSFRAGHNMSHHGHYDAGHFTLFKGAPLAVTGATYRGNLNAGHRLDYGVRTVSKNSLLIMRPGEEVQPDRYELDNVADGGQRVTMPIRNPLSTLQDWRDNLGKGMRLEGGRILAYRHELREFTYINADITRAYNTPEHDEGGEGGKVSMVTRKLLYLRRLDRVLIRDVIQAVDPTYKAKWLLQSMVKPDLEQGILLKGAPDNGILSTEQAEFRFSNKRGRLHVLSLLPKSRETLVIGGKHFRFYTDIDGNSETLDGENRGHNSRITSWFEPALWRLEISDRRPVKEQDFLTLLSPSVEQYNPPQAKLLDSSAEGVIMIQIDDEIIVFVENSELRALTVPGLPEARYLRIFGLPKEAEVTAAGSRYSATGEGTLTVVATEQPIKIQWTATESLGNR